MIKSLENPT